MYDSNVITNIINDAKDVIAKKRKKYGKLMKIIEHFISENDIIVKEVSEYFFDLFTLDMFNLPMQLTNLLYENEPILAKYIILEIKIYKYHSRILIDGIPFVHFTYINPEIRNNILDYQCKGIYTNAKFKCFGPEILLINVYANLVNPALYKEWRDFFSTEEQMSSEILDNLSSRIGGGYITKKDSIVNQMIDYYTDYLKSNRVYRNTNKKVNIIYDLYANINTNIDKYRLLLYNNFIDKEHVLVGKNAINIYNNIDKLERIQIITSRPLLDEVKTLKELLGTSITYSINNLKIPTNLNLHKMTIFYEKDAIIDIYDAGNYELINYNNISDINKSINNIKSTIQLGSPFVLMRFRLIDIWSTLYSIKTGILSKDVGMSIVHKLLSDYILIRNKLNKMDINNIFSLKYIGFFEDINLNKLRVVNRLKTNFIQPYVPFLQKK